MQNIENNINIQTKLLFDAIPNALIITNNSYEIEFLNKKAIDIIHNSSTVYLHLNIFLFFNIQQEKYTGQEINSKNNKWAIQIPIGTSNNSVFFLKYTSIIEQTEEIFHLFEIEENTQINKNEKTDNKQNTHRILYEVAQQLLDLDDFNKIVENMYKVSKLLTRSSSGFFAVFGQNRNDDKMLFTDIHNTLSYSNSPMPSQIWRVVDAILIENSGCIINDFQNSKFQNTLPLNHLIINNLLLVPLRINNKMLGLIGLCNNPTDFLSSDVDFVQFLSYIASISINNILIHKELKEKKNLAQEREQLKTNFLANITHEIRTPMNSIIGFSDILQIPGIPDDKKMQYAATIKTKCKQLLAIFDDILDISKIETGQIFANKAVGNINSMLLEIFADFKIKTNNSAIQLHIFPGFSDANAQIRTDFLKVRQVFSNLISNAFKFTSAGHIDFGYIGKENYIECFVKDTGIGIPQDMHEAIFERFRQLEEPFSRTYGGTGLGLSIAKAYVELLGGRIFLESSPGKGSTFYFTIPFSCDADPASVISILTTSNKKTVVLVAEDEDMIFLYVNEVLTENDFEVLRAINGKEAVEISNLRNDIDVIIMDLKMPELDGIDALKLIRAQKPNIPVIAHTAFAFAHNKKSLKELGFNAFLIKPANDEILVQTIKRSLVNL